MHFCRHVLLCFHAPGCRLLHLQLNRFIKASALAALPLTLQHLTLNLCEGDSVAECKELPKGLRLQTLNITAAGCAAGPMAALLPHCYVCLLVPAASLAPSTQRRVRSALLECVQGGGALGRPVPHAAVQRDRL